MKKKRNRLIIFSVILMLVTVCIFRYYEINHNVARKYQIDKYSIGQTFKLDDYEIKVNSFKIENSNDNRSQTLDCIIDVEIRNITKKTLVCGPIECSSLSLGTDFSNCATVIGEVNKINKFLPNSKANITLQYVFPKELYNSYSKNSIFSLYIDKSLYKNQILKKAKENKLYGKCVDLGRGE